jgi:hypothetical protein
MVIVTKNESPQLPFTHPVGSLVIRFSVSYSTFMSFLKLLNKLRYPYLFATLFQNGYTVVLINLLAACCGTL